MGKFNYWWKVIFIVFFSSNCTIAQKERKIVRSGYYFVIQIEAIKKDTIYYKTINIYSTTPNLDLKDFESLSNKSKKNNLFVNRNFKVGLFEKARFNLIGEIIILNTTIENIDESGFVQFKKPIHLKKIRLSDFYEVKKSN